MTNGDKKMANSIKVVFPEVQYRLRMWHLMMNMWKNGSSKFVNGFIKCTKNIKLLKVLKELVFHHGAMMGIEK